jgi:hypothetical protein
VSTKPGADPFTPTFAGSVRNFVFGVAPRFGPNRCESAAGLLARGCTSSAGRPVHSCVLLRLNKEPELLAATLDEDVGVTVGADDP